MRRLATLAACLLLAVPTLAQERDAARDEAWTAKIQEIVAALPAYDGKHRYVLAPEERERALNVTRSLEAAPEGHGFLA